MKKIVLTSLATSALIFANVSDKEIANMFILGFYGTNATPNTKIYKDICYRGLGGVILFKRNPSGKGIKNFSSKASLKRLTNNLKSCGTKPIIAIDQEGGLVQRVKFKYKYPKASFTAKKGLAYASMVYSLMGEELSNLGINLNFAPVADLALNKNNKVIYKFGRSYGANPQKVIRYDKVFIDSMHKYGVKATLKHFPGHGSSLGDTHKGFVDVTNRWKRVELTPYKALKYSADAVMVAHIFNRKLDSNYPASLSKKVVTNLLREQIGYQGVVVTDDMQMGAIKQHYSLKKQIELAINAGDDLLLFANQLSPRDNIQIEQLISIVRSLLNEGKISEQSIKDANYRIYNFKKGLRWK